ncbi:hypothetical protein MKW94_001101, partial [Papaver nudicaule]|nr:hypothetical protein [Papaver nudicaule]
MSRSIFASSRRIVSKASVLPHGVRCYLGSPSPARKISVHSPIFPKNTLENEPRPPNSELLASLYRPGDALNFNVGQQWSSNKVLEMWQSAEALIG